MMAGQRAGTTQHLGLVFAIFAGAAAVMFGRAPLALVAPRPCPGLPELATLALARLTPALPVALWIAWVNGVVLFVGITWVTRLAQRVCANIPIGTAAGFAVAAWTVASPSSTLLHGAGVLLTAAVAWQALSVDRFTSRVTTWVPLAAAAAVWPPSAAACALTFLFAARATRRFDRATVVAAFAIAAVAALASAVALRGAGGAAIVACLAPGRPSNVVANGWGAVSAAGPYVCALAALGLMAWRRRVDAWLLVPVALLLPGPQQPSLSVLSVALGIAASCGLVELARACRTGPGGRFAAALLVLLAPALAWQTSRAAPPPVADAHTFGHDRLSFALVQRLVGPLPPDARVVSEDANTDVLLRGLRREDMTMRASDDMSEVALALSKHQRVFALPLAQRALAQHGYRLDDVGPGVAEVRAGAECRVVTNEWRRVEDLEATQSFTLVARTPSEAGPVVVYASFDTPPRLAPVDWPTPALRGFYTTVYDSTVAEDRARLSQDVSDDGAPADRIVRDRRYLARLELWRTPTAPMRLTVALGAQPHDVNAQVIARTEPRRLMVCPTYAHDVGRFGG